MCVVTIGVARIRFQEAVEKYATTYKHNGIFIELKLQISDDKKLRLLLLKHT